MRQILFSFWLVLFLNSCTPLPNPLFDNLFLTTTSSHSDVRVIQYPQKKQTSSQAIILEDISSKKIPKEQKKDLPKPSQNKESMDEKNSHLQSLQKKVAKIEQQTGKKLKVLLPKQNSQPLFFEENRIEKKDSSIVVHKVTQITAKRPEYIQGIYISNYTIRSPEIMKKHIADAKKHGINTFVIDVQPRQLSKEVIDNIIDNGIYPVARVVVFEGGLAQEKPSKEHIDKIVNYIGSSAKVGFLEVQLDYIRYADYQRLRRLSLDFKYKVIDEILDRAQKEAIKNNVLISADLFGRITLNYNDHIGQKLEIFAKRMDVLYPMLYPSHYYSDNFRTTNPYHTVKEGMKNSIDRVGDQSQIVGYIQGFQMYVDKTGLSFTEYIRQQIQAVEDSGGHGWIIWNPHNKYEVSYLAMQAEKKRKQKK